MAQFDAEECLAFLIPLAAEAGKMIKAAFEAPKQIQFKGAIDLVTETDQAVEAFLLEHIKQKYPTHSFVAEEVQANRSFSLGI